MCLGQTRGEVHESHAPHVLLLSYMSPWLNPARQFVHSNVMRRWWAHWREVSIIYFKSYISITYSRAMVLFVWLNKRNHGGELIRTLKLVTLRLVLWQQIVMGWWDESSICWKFHPLNKLVVSSISLQHSPSTAAALATRLFNPSTPGNAECSSRRGGGKTSWGLALVLMDNLASAVST